MKNWNLQRSTFYVHRDENRIFSKRGIPVRNRVGIKPGFYHKAQPGGFYGFYEGGFFRVLWVLCGFYKSENLSLK